MPDPPTLAAFFVASLALLVMPGPTVMYIVARGINQGRSAALVSTLGVEVGTLIQLLVATLGLSALVASSDATFAAIRYLGAGYLVWLALGVALDEGRHALDDLSASGALRPVFLQGVLVEVLNPKTALFFLAFLPQFTNPERGSVTGQMLLLGMVFILLAICNDGLVGLLAGALAAKLREDWRFLAIQRHVSGCLYMTLAASTALASSGMH